MFHLSCHFLKAPYTLHIKVVLIKVVLEKFGTVWTLKVLCGTLKGPYINISYSLFLLTKCHTATIPVKSGLLLYFKKTFWALKGTSGSCFIQT
jgi:hypothetical protein